MKPKAMSTYVHHPLLGPLRLEHTEKGAIDSAYHPDGQLLCAELVNRYEESLLSLEDLEDPLELHFNEEFQELGLASDYLSPIVHRHSRN